MIDKKKHELLSILDWLAESSQSRQTSLNSLEEEIRQLEEYMFENNIPPSDFGTDGHPPRNLQDDHDPIC